MRHTQKGTEPKFWAEQLEPRILLSTSGLESAFASSLIPEDEISPIPALVVEVDDSLINNDSQESVEYCEVVPDDCDSVPAPIATIGPDSAGSQQEPEVAEDNLTSESDLGVDNAEVMTISQINEMAYILAEGEDVVSQTSVYDSSSNYNAGKLSSGIVENKNNSSTEWLVKTQRAANPPPISAGDALDLTLNALTESQLLPITEEAISRLSVFYLVTDRDIDLSQVTFEITDLKGDVLAEVAGQSVSLDITAAGHGWFVDLTSSDDAEFTESDGDGLIADSNSAAFGRIDLLTVVMHELGHVLGLEDLDAYTNAGELMAGTINPGERRLADFADDVTVHDYATLSGLEVNSSGVITDETFPTFEHGVDYIDTLEVEIAATDSFDRVTVTGAATLGGTMNISRLGGYVPQAGALFEVITYASASGDFADYTGQEIQESLRFIPIRGPGRLLLAVANLPLPGVRMRVDEMPQIEDLEDFFTGDDSSKTLGFSGTLAAADQEVDGTFVLKQETTTDGVDVVTVVAEDVEMTFTDGTTDIVSISGSGHLIVSEEGMAGELEVEVDAAIPDVGLDAGLTGTYTLLINTGTEAVNDAVQIGGRVIVFDIPAGPFVRIEGRDVKLSLTASSQGFVIEGDFLIEESQTDDGDPIVKIEAENLSANVSVGTAVLMFEDGEGAFLLNADGVAGKASGRVRLEGVDEIDIRSELDLEFNNTGSPLDETIGSTVLQFTEGSFLRVKGSATMNVAGFVDLSGNFAFEKAKDSSEQNVLKVMVDALVDGNIVRLALMVFGDGTFAASGEADAGLFNLFEGLVLSGSLQLLVNTTGREDIDESFDVAGQTVLLQFGAGQGNMLRFVGANIVLITPIADISGTIVFEKDLATNEVLALGTGVEIFAGDKKGTADTLDDAGLKVGPADFALLLMPDGSFAFVGSGAVQLVNLGADFVFTGEFSAEINTTGQDINRTVEIEVGGIPQSIDMQVLADVSRLEGQGITLQTPAGDLTGNFVVEKSTVGPDGIAGTADDETEILIAASGLNVSIGDSFGVSVTDAQFILLITADNEYAFQANGTAEVFGITGLILSGSLGLQYNTLTDQVTRQITVGGVTSVLDVPAAADAVTPFTRFGGTGVVLELLGTHISGDFSFVRNGTDIDVQVDNASASLLEGLVAAEGVAAAFTITSTGIDATVAVDQVVVDLPDFDFGGSMELEIHYSDDGDDTNDSLSVAVGEDGNLAPLEIAGQTLTGVFLLEKGTSSSGNDVVKAALSQVGLSLGDGSNTFVSIADASGQFIISEQGVSGALTVADATLTVPDLLNGTFAVDIQVNTASESITETFFVGGSDVTLTLPAGPYIRVVVVVEDASPIMIAGNKLIGNFFFERLIRAGPDGLVEEPYHADNEIITRVAVSNVSVTFSGETDPVLTDGEGGFIITTNGIAGFISGTAAIETAGVEAGGSVLLRVNTTGDAVDEVINLNGKDIVIRFSADEGDVFALSVSDLSLNIAGVVTIEGSVSFTSKTLSDEVTIVEAFAGEGLTVFFGDGPAVLANGDPNPLAKGLMLSDARIGLIRDGDMFAMNAHGTLELLGFTGVDISGTARVRVNSFTTSLDETLTIPGTDGQVFVTFGALEVAEPDGTPFALF
ncbi:MAG: LEPR-XLL domain-containing protein, partial [Planctomycetota bacterium]